MSQGKYLDRVEAGRILSQYLMPLKNANNTVILALPRGGVPVAHEIAQALKLPLDVMIVRKIGAPHHEEYAIGAIASGGVQLFNQQALIDLSVDQNTLDTIVEQQTLELQRREKLYRPGKQKQPITNQTIILVDDGIATGFTIHAAILAIQKLKPKRLIVVVPVSSVEAHRTLTPLVDEFICPLIPEHFNAVGAWYEQFPQTQDDEVIDILKRY